MNCGVKLKFAYYSLYRSHETSCLLTTVETNTHISTNDYIINTKTVDADSLWNVNEYSRNIQTNLYPKTFPHKKRKNISLILAAHCRHICYVNMAAVWYCSASLLKRERFEYHCKEMQSDSKLHTPEACFYVNGRKYVLLFSSDTVIRSALLL